MFLPAKGRRRNLISLAGLRLFPSACPAQPSPECWSWLLRVEGSRGKTCLACHSEESRSDRDDEESRKSLVFRARFLSRDCGIGKTKGHRGFPQPLKVSLRGMKSHSRLCHRRLWAGRATGARRWIAGQLFGDNDEEF